ncbi:MOSC domain-containing protein [Cellulomonas alba]|uniref:MOSC domain-containing protein n=1 Tax=Cellulomonas alba TaxID=3053467 RepID=A0ABT7SBZ9_9CELL|nr:MOSC N-terminal beta barrel domain-containing protein [Cellulomonas alba]MDM7853708.1 MOSC domain-containing protein [Cellulomonas alba]
MRIASLHVYPVKSLRGMDVGAADVERQGLRGDRRWMVIEHDGSNLTARKHPPMLGVRAVADGAAGLRLSAAGLPDLHVEAPGTDVERIEVGLSRVGTATPAGEAADAWLTRALDRPARLVWLDDPTRRSVAPEHGGRPGDTLSFADDGPLLVTTTASMERLNAWIREAHPEHATLPMERFRPNLVVDGADEPFAEDAWRSMRVGDVELRFAEQCDRCVMTTIDLETLRTGKEPIRTLARHRRWDGKTWFGVRMVPVTTGRVAVGDAVEVADA